MPGVSDPAAVAGRFSVPAVRRAKELAATWGSAAMRGLRLPELGDGRDDFPGYSQAAVTLVPGDVGGHQPEERCQRNWTATSAGLGKLQDGVDLAA